MKKFGVLVMFLIIIVLSACKPAPAPTAQPTEAPKPTEIVEQPIATPEPTPYEEVTLKFNYSKLMSYAPIFIAEQEGYFKQFGITLEPVTFNKSSEALPLLASGDLDVYAGVVNAGLLNVLSNEPNVKVVADRGSITPEDACTYVGIMIRKDLVDNGAVKGASDLKGQVIALSVAGSTGYLLDKYLGEAGLSMKDVVINDIPTASYVDGFANKSVAAIVAPELHITRLNKAGNSVLVAGLEDFGTTQLSVLVFGKSLTVDHPDIAARFLAAYLLGVQKYNEGKTDSNIQAIAAATGEDISLVKDSCWVPIRQDASINFEGISNFQAWLIDQKLLDKPVTEEQFWNPAFLKAANELLKK